jgi:hypothetical protein
MGVRLILYRSERLQQPAVFIYQLSISTHWYWICFKVVNSHSHDDFDHILGIHGNRHQYPVRGLDFYRNRRKHFDHPLRLHRNKCEYIHHDDHDHAGLEPDADHVAHRDCYIDLRARTESNASAHLPYGPQPASSAQVHRPRSLRSLHRRRYLFLGFRPLLPATRMGHQ